MPQNPQGAYVATRAVGSSNVASPLKVDSTLNLLVGKGISTALNLSASTVVKATPGRVCKVNVITAGSAPGTINDCATTGAIATSNQVATIPNTVGQYDIDFPCLVGITYGLGTGQVVAISYN